MDGDCGFLGEGDVSPELKPGCSSSFPFSCLSFAILGVDRSVFGVVSIAACACSILATLEDVYRELRIMVCKSLDVLAPPVELKRKDSTNTVWDGCVRIRSVRGDLPVQTVQFSSKRRSREAR